MKLKEKIAGFIFALLILIVSIQIDWLVEQIDKYLLCESGGIVCYPDKTVFKLEVPLPDGQRYLTYTYGPDNTLLYLVWRSKGERYDNITSFFYPNGELRQKQTYYRDGAYRIDSYSSAGLLTLRQRHNKKGEVYEQEEYYPNGILRQIRTNRTILYYHPNGELYENTKEIRKVIGKPLDSDKYFRGGDKLLEICPRGDIECLEESFLTPELEIENINKFLFIPEDFREFQYVPSWDNILKPNPPKGGIPNIQIK